MSPEHPSDTDLPFDVLAKLEKLSGNASRSPGEMFGMLMGLDEILDNTMPSGEEIKRAEDFKFPANNKLGKWAFLCPQGDLSYGRWMAFSLLQRAKELGFSDSFEPALVQEYDTSRLTASAFNIADICQEAGVKAAFVLLPRQEVADKALRDEFFSIVSHILESMLIPCTSIEHEKLKSPAAYTRALLDMT